MQPRSPDEETTVKMANILKVADSYDAIISDRAYRRGSPQRVALADILAKSKKDSPIYDPKVVQVAIEALRPFEKEAPHLEALEDILELLPTLMEKEFSQQHLEPRLEGAGVGQTLALVLVQPNLESIKRWSRVRQFVLWQVREKLAARFGDMVWSLHNQQFAAILISTNRSDSRGVCEVVKNEISGALDKRNLLARLEVEVRALSDPGRRLLCCEKEFLGQAKELMELCNEDGSEFYRAEDLAVCFFGVGLAETAQHSVEHGDMELICGTGDAAGVLQEITQRELKEATAKAALGGNPHRIHFNPNPVVFCKYPKGQCPRKS